MDKRLLIILILLSNFTLARMGKVPPSQLYNILTKNQMETYQLKPVLMLPNY
jgi:hypothetical protein